MTRISDETLNDHLLPLADEWEAVRAHQAEAGRNATLDGKGGNIWWINQTAYVGESFGVALIRDLAELRAMVRQAVIQCAHTSDTSVQAAMHPLARVLDVKLPWARHEDG